MSLQNDLKPYFSASLRGKGEQYYFGGRIQITTGNDFKVEGKAIGTSVYKVILEAVDEEIEGYCECPYYRDNGVCKHLWGLVLMADDKGHLGRNRDSFVPTVSSFDDAMQWFDSRRTRKKPAAPPKPAPVPKWKQLLDSVVSTGRILEENSETWREGREIYFVIDRETFQWAETFSISIQMREKNQAGAWGKLKDHNINRGQVALIPDPAERELVSLLGGKLEYSYGTQTDRVPIVVRMPSTLVNALLPRICATGKCLLRSEKNQSIESMPVMQWDDENPFHVELHLDEVGEEYVLAGRFRRGEEIVDLTEPSALYESGFFIVGSKISRFRADGMLAWLHVLRREKKVSIHKDDAPAFRKELLKSKSVPVTNWPKSLAFTEVSSTPKPSIHFSPVETSYRSSSAPKLEGALSFDYGHAVYPWGAGGSGEFIESKNLFLRRDISAEAEAAARLESLGLKKESSFYDHRKTKWTIPSKRLPAVVRELLAEGWHVAAEGKTFRQAASFNAELTSGVDWFELRGSVDFGEGSLDLPQLIKALEKGENLVALADGSYGMLPNDFMSKYGMLLQLGKTTGDHIQFKKSQTGLLDVFLAERESEIKVDALFEQARQQVRSFTGIEPLRQPAGFKGELRAYQCEGLGWMSFLEKAGWGGCLADDMGVGKTAQVLAMLEGRRQLKHGPSLAVLPRTLIYNWMREAAKFTPELRVLDNSGADRTKETTLLKDYDLVLTTYGAMRRDVLNFKDFVFDYVILDEAQAIKNAASESAKAARLLKANHRLALSGTPIENHLGELWSLFEFLNPGMMGGAKGMLAGNAVRNPDADTRHLLARAVRPFILRRTKEQVVKELPAKTEQTLYCELEPDQRKLYNELLDYYRQSLLGKIDKQGMGKSKMMILEALLRLRQAACHPGLIDKERVGESSAKLDELLPKLEEVLEEGHKALVFSQFTSLLSIVREHLDKNKIVYEYLDGSTKDREAHVERFQNDPDCKLFLISLKAGGVGLNLTAADYVFLLDPWWNPAAEAQAIDRTHRIGQQRPVFAYRLIAKDTVEEKVLELQKSKRELADSIISEDNRFVGNLKREDLELLFS